MCLCFPVIGIKFDVSNKHCFLFERGDKTPGHPYLQTQRKIRGPRYPLYLLLYNEDKRFLKMQDFFITHQPSDSSLSACDPKSYSKLSVEKRKARE